MKVQITKTVPPNDMCMFLFLFISLLSHLNYIRFCFEKIIAINNLITSVVELIDPSVCLSYFEGHQKIP
jgi:hypothetical protein